MGTRATIVLGSGLAILGSAAVTLAAPAHDGGLFDPALIRDYHLTFEMDGWEAALTAAGDLGNVPAALVVGDEALDDVGVRYKGLSSMFIRTRKRPLNLTTDAFVPGQRLLGFDVVNLNNGYSDPSFVREALITERLRPYMPAQRTAYANVHVNGERLGAYLAVEQVEGTFLDAWFPDSDGILIKGDPPAGPPPGARTFFSSLAWEGEDLEAYRPNYEVKTDGAEEEGLTLVREAARALDAPVSAGGVPDSELRAAIPEVLDVDRALWYLAANNLFVNYDSYYFGHNYFLYHAEEDDRLHLLLWDTSLGFGGLDLGPWGLDASGGAGPRVDPFALELAPERPVIRRLLSVPEWRADYVAHYRTLLDEAFDPEALAERGAELQAVVRPSLAIDPNRLFTPEQFDANLFDEVVSFVNMGPGGRSPGVVSFAQARADWLRSLPALAAPDHALVEHSRAPLAPAHGEAATIALRFEGGDEPSAVRVDYRVDAGRPASVELVREGEAWRGKIPGQAPAAVVSYFARAAFADGRAAFHPAANLTQAWGYEVGGVELPMAPAGDLVLNEIQAANVATLADEAGEHDDWIELYNRGTTPIDLAGYFLSDDPADPWAFPLPDGLVLAPGAHLLVWCDNDPEQGPLHAPFALARDGEHAVLSTADAIVDILAFGPQAADMSLARLPDGAGGWWECGSPTPGEANACEGPSEPLRTPTAEPTGTAEATPGVDPTAVPETTATAVATARATEWAGGVATVILPWVGR